MLYDVSEMLAWNYEEAMTIYEECMRSVGSARSNAILNDFKMYMQAVANQQCSRVYDYTKNPQYGRECVARVRQNFKHGTLILVDGESGTGKTTFAKKLCQKESFFLFDIDEYAEKLLMEHLFSENGGLVFFDQKQDELLRQHTERIIREGSDNGKKTTVMVGCFRNVIFRTIIAHTIGKYFEKVVSIVIHDELEANLARIKMRNGHEVSEATSLAHITYNDMEELKQVIAFYGVGCDASCWINHAAVHDFE